ncbi:uncharacterized protein UTRI_05554_B [Ustilago trichophora]|uniref:Uncharacterized protein n=1 Tax=Ustilago trichophora TaxID=86804 RepID=A0A5C3EJJ8_9BASI|nr:uncharacterized protein UTRI_05554_B [Ustilago trichophora]
MFHNAPSSPVGGGHNTASYGLATPIRAPSTSSYHNAGYSSHALTPASDKAVRFQSQPLPPQTQQHSSAAPALTPNRFGAGSASSSSLQAQIQSPQQQQQQQQKPISTAPSAPTTSSMPATRPAVAASTTSVGNEASTIALSRRIKWNVGALALLWILPALSSKPRDVYWAILDQIYMHVGGEADELVDGVIGWIMWAISVVLLFNAVEAGILIRRSSSPAFASRPAQTLPNTPLAAGRQVSTAVLGMHSPQVAKSINFVAASRLKGSPKTRTSSIGAGSPISHSQSLQKGTASSSQSSPTVDYSQFSPSLRRSSPVVSSSPTHHQHNSNGGGFGGTNNRMHTPTSGTGAEYGMGLGGGNNSSPLAAFRARHATTSRGSPSPSSIRARSITPSVSNGGFGEVDLSLGDVTPENDVEGATFLGDESFEVDRALRSLRGSMGGVSSTPAGF